MESLFYRNYLKYLRDKFYLAQSEIADFLHCSISTYSKMEQGKKEISFDDFEAVIHFYEKKKKGYSFCFDENKKKESKDLIRKCITAFIYRSQKEMLNELESYLADPSNLHSYAFFETKLIEMIYEYFSDLPFQEQLPFMLEHMNLYDHTEQSLIYDLLGLSQLRTYIKKAEASFQT
ncbi:helix-turn-helix domain-containing protein [Dubosiella newyorkensis]|uniref:helix-turn-helix domain-containing protein n=1 Tax=Dubosiella newyorkensis TaxID=1862672 RepID=UPI003F67FCD4